MIHTKSLIRRLAYVPWLLALGLVVGWTGTAEAVDITLSLDKSTVREDAGTTEITVTAKASAKVKGNVHVVLSYEATADPLNQRFRITVPTIVIANDTDTKKGTIQFIPVNDNYRGVHGDFQDNGAADNLEIDITGIAGTGNTVASTTLTMIDDDKLTRNLSLRFDPGNLSREAERNDVDVIVSIDGSRLASKHSFDVVFKNTVGDARNDLFDKTPGTQAEALKLLDADEDGTLDATENVLVRDSQYWAQSAKINLGRRKREASGTIPFDPFNFAGYAAIEADISGAGARFFPLSDPTGTDAGYPDPDDSSWTGRDAADPGPPRSHVPTPADPDGDGTENWHALDADDAPTAGDGSTPNDERRYHLIRAGAGFIPTVGGTVVTPVTAPNFLRVTGIDLNSDGDTGDVIELTKVTAAVGALAADADQATKDDAARLDIVNSGRLTERALGIDVNGDGNDDGETTDASNPDGLDLVSELNLGIDLDGNGILTTAGAAAPLLDLGNTMTFTAGSANTANPNDNLAITSFQEKNMPFGVMVRAGFFQVKDEPDPIVKSVKIVPGMMREEEGERTFKVEVELSRKRPSPSHLEFEIEDATEDGCEDCAGIRDIDYTADIVPLTIGANQTKGTTDITVSPVDNDEEDEAKVFVLKASVARTEAKTFKFTIADDELPTTTVTLTANPATVTSGTGPQDIDVTATLNGKVFDEDKTFTLILNHNRESDKRTTAERDIDFDASVYALTIKAGDVTGTAKVSVTGIPKATGDLKIGLTALEAGKGTPWDVLDFKNEDEEDVKIVPAVITLKPAPAEDLEEAELDVADLSITTYRWTAGLPVSQELPEASGGTGMARYSVSSNLPAGLTFNSATRTIEGTPTEEVEATEIVYTVIDAGNSVATLFSVEIGPEPPPTVAVSTVELSQASVREGGETVEISVKATFEEAATVAETITFTITDSDAGTSAVRDADYTAALVGNVDIEVGDTQATTTLTLTAVDNSKEDGNRFLAVQANGSGGSASEDIKIADDETASTSVLLSATPNTVAEDAGLTDVTVTASLDGKVQDADVAVSVSIDPASSATRDEDYVALFVAMDPERTVEPVITIPANSVSGSVILRLNPAADSEDEGNESIMLTGSADDLGSGSATITLADPEMMEEDDDMMMALMFAEGTMIDDITATAGTEIAEVELPAAEGGSGDITYSVSELPAGLAFDAETRKISGTPEAAGTTEITYTATDGEGATTEKTFSIVINPMLDFGDLGGLFGALTGGAGKANPASEHEGGTHWVIDQPIAAIQVPDDATLQALGGGTPPYTISISGLPAGVSYDDATRMISGTPSEVGDTIVLILVTDSNGASAPLPPFNISVILPPLGAPSNLVAQDYAGADGQGDQGGFLLLTWELSEHHDEIDGYRIFRALPVLANEMVPWAMVDAVPGVERGVAVVATLDNVSTRWGIAAERSGQTTHGAAKAVFVSADQPYAQMAKTLMASMEAAQAGDAPVFASLLPEALAYAQGVAPKLNVVPGVLSSAVVFTDEPVRAIDNIAPLAVPSFSVLDAPDDQGSRIALTWTLSPSDQVLQDVIAGAVGPLGVEPVVGVYGYNIYRRAAGEDEFAMIAQVDAGITSFVDETALNGVRYTYQVRPYDLDNETGSDIEHTAMAVRNIAVDSEGRTIFGLFGADNRIGFDDFFIFADNFGLTAEDTGFDPAFDLSPNATIDFEDFFVFADNFGRSTAAAGKRVPMLAGMNADARMYLDARTALPSVGEDFVLDLRVADFAAIKGYGLQVQYEADKLEFVQVLTDEPLGGSALATPQVLADEAGVLTVVAHGDVVSEGEVALSLVFRPTTEIENTLIEITDNQTYDSEFGFNRLALPVPVQLQTRPEAFALANNYPNPFNPATTIKYALPQAADVELTVYNVVGQVVRTLVAEHQSAGRYVVEWDATNDNGHSLSSGMYFYRLEAGGEFHEVKKMLLLK